MNAKISKREYMEKFMRQEAGLKSPVGFWQHFVGAAEHHYGLTDETVLPRVVAGQKKFIDDYQPDFVKIMSDGFFSHPAMQDNKINTVEDLDKIQPAPNNHPWFSEQVEFCKTIHQYVGDDCMIFYSIFSPMNYIRLRFDEVEQDGEKFPRLFMEDPERMARAMEVICDDVIKLVQMLRADGAIDGFYYSVQSVQHDKADDAWHEQYVKPSDVAVAQAMHDAGAKILLHICGWGEFTNPVYRYVDYPADIINWATNAEKLSLAEGKKLFDGKPVLGGFDNNPGTLLYTGTKEEIKDAVYEILAETGEQGVAIGADCTLGDGLPHWVISYVQDVVREYHEKQQV